MGPKGTPGPGISRVLSNYLLYSRPVTPTSNRLDLSTLVSISLPAFALEPFVHEFLGHACTAWLQGAKVILVSSTAMQTEGGTRLVPAAGPLSNLVFGALTVLLLRRMPRLTPLRYFVWIFALANLFLCFGYVLFSGLTNFGDSAVVIAGLRPAWLFRLSLVVFGYFGYRYSVGFAVRDLLSLIRSGNLLRSDVARLAIPACTAGGILYFVASLFNPVDPKLILYDGLPMAGGIAIGFCLIPGLVKKFSASASSSPPASESSSPALAALPFSPAWLMFAVFSSAAFLYFLGRGFRP